MEDPDKKTHFPDAFMIRYLRRELKLSTAKLAREARIGQRTLEVMEKGSEKHRPDVFEMLHKAIQTQISTHLAGPPDNRLAPFLGYYQDKCNETVLQDKSPIGRREVFNQIREKLTAAARRTALHLAIHGPAGIGKSHLVDAILEDPIIRGHFGPECIHHLVVGPNCDPVGLLAELGTARGVDKVPDAAKLDQLAASKWVRSACKGKNLLLILDDVWEFDVFSLLNVIDPMSSSSILFTTRNAELAILGASDSALRLDLPEFEYAFEILAMYGEQAVEEARNECELLVRTLEYLPLSLEIAGRLLSFERKNPAGVLGLIDDLSRELALLELRVPGKSHKVDALLNLSYEHLDPRDQPRYLQLGPFAHKPGDFDLPGLASTWLNVRKGALSEEHLDDARNTLAALLDLHLVNRTRVKERFHIHSLLRQHAIYLAAALNQGTPS